MASPLDFDYSRPQAWRNMPQRSNNTNTDGHLSYEREKPIQRIGHSSGNVSTASVDSMAHSSIYRDASVADTSSLTAATAVTSDGFGGNKETASASSVASSATRSSVDTAVETMWEARRKREKAEEEADQKLLDAVCKASLVEFNNREQVLKHYETETSQKSLEHQTSSIALQQAKSEAEQRKHVAMQAVIDCKTRAKLMSEKAREATLLYQQKNSERLAKQAELAALKLRGEQEAEMLVVQKRKDEAIRKRAEAEQKAHEARTKAEAMRHQAFQAASKIRANSRRQIETQLGEEEAQRRREMQRKLDEIEKIKELAHQKRKAAAKKAEDARRRAEALRLKAEEARAGLKSA